ncbi:hypothetical protein [Bdellovibrio sp. NC01]|uniref:hypothetical protein n=1 Tax=Bdellovibrio sp. NC01 TaxID=2220073 RepID=UPI00352C952B
MFNRGKAVCYWCAQNSREMCGLCWAHHPLEQTWLITRTAFSFFDEVNFLLTLL